MTTSPSSHRLTAASEEGVAECPGRAGLGIIRPDGEPIRERRLRDSDELLARERDARRQLDAEKAVRERLLATLTTELVTHANVARGWLRLIQREHLPMRERERAFAKVDAALDAQLALLDELVGMSPAAAGHVNLDCRRVDVAAIARAVAADVGDERAHVVAPETAFVVADVEHVVRALQSLLNATTRAADSVLLDVGVSGDRVHLRFSNGIREDDAALAIARRVAALYAGDLEIAADQTVFRLPVARSD